MLREAGAMVPKCLADAGKDGVMSCRNSQAKGGAPKHNVGGRFDCQWGTAVQVLSCPPPHLTSLAIVGSCKVTRRMPVIAVPGARSWKAQPSMSRESLRRRRKSAVNEEGARMQRAVRIAQSQRFREDADGMASQPCARASALLIKRLASGIHFAY